MPTQISAIYQAQYIPDGAAAKLVFTLQNGLLNGGTVVPAGVQVLLFSIWVANRTAGIATLELWRGSAATGPNELISGPINVPPPTFAIPGLQVLTAPIVLMPGDSIWGISGTHQALNITGDGQIISQ